jgi:hypothetical protein
VAMSSSIEAIRPSSEAIKKWFMINENKRYEIVKSQVRVGG